MLKQYIIRKYVLANNVQEALRKEKHVRADEAWIDSDWKGNQEVVTKKVGFK